MSAKYRRKYSSLKGFGSSYWSLSMGLLDKFGIMYGDFLNMRYFLEHLLQYYKADTSFRRCG
jgi:hypothetical protein